MRSTSHFWAFIAVAGIGCGGGGDARQVAVTDTANRDLQLAPVDTSAALGDVARPDTAGTTAPAPAPETPAAARPKPATKTSKPATTATSKPAAPAPVRSLDAGTKISATTRDTITSATNKVGDMVKLRVASDVVDAQGRTVIPAGSTITARVAAIKWSENKSDKGTLRLEPTSVDIGGVPYDVAGTIANPAFTYTKRGSVLGDAAKPAAGAAAGAVVGGLLGKGTGAVIGGVVGGAVGTQRMVETKDRDIVVAPGSTATIELTSAFKR